MKRKDFVVWSQDRGMFWRSGWHGYTTRADKAGRFSKEEAERILERANGHLRLDEPRKEIMLNAPDVSVVLDEYHLVWSHDELATQLDEAMITLDKAAEALLGLKE